MAKTTHGTHLIERRIERLVRQRIVDSLYYKQHCFGLNAESLIDKAAALEYVGGTFGANHQPSPFLCLLYRMLNINIDKEIVLAFIQNEHYKYLRLLGAFYFRITEEHPQRIYETLEPLLSNYTKIVVRLSPTKEKPHGFHLSFTDAIIDDMLTKDFMFSISLPTLPSRPILAAQERLSSPLRSSLLFSIEPNFLSQLAADFEKEKEEASHRLILKGQSRRRSRSTFDHQQPPQDADADENPQSVGMVPSSSDFNLSLSVSATNSLRQDIGLAPLKP